ncbi:LPS export ABC transporter periplasmic protein LptC [Agrobacterium sp. ES01]|uniref:LPS export ABC transporter periplasmic protein LptC n=1 Tax=Agrobacterium sp. ES01 TaxID=3420714 RepID=UPI003D12A7AF
MLNRVADNDGIAARSVGRNAYASALRHSVRVRRLKVLLPIAATLISLAFIAVSVVRTYLPENLNIDSARIENGKIVMEKPAISGRNKDGISYSMRAERALQDIKNPNIITLEDIAAAVPVNDKVTARVVATSGIFDRTADRLDMEEPFTLTLSNGLVADFQSAHLDIPGGNMDTSDPVSIKANEASIVADSLKITDKGRTITFAGHVKVNIEPSTIRQQGN